MKATRIYQILENTKTFRNLSMDKQGAVIAEIDSRTEPSHLSLEREHYIKWMAGRIIGEEVF